MKKNLSTLGFGLLGVISLFLFFAYGIDHGHKIAKKIKDKKTLTKEES